MRTVKLGSLFVYLYCAVLVIGPLYLLYIAFKHHGKCMEVCNDDPVEACYEHRTVCVGRDGIYTRDVK